MTKLNATATSKRLRAAGLAPMRVRVAASHTERTDAGAFVEVVTELSVRLTPAEREAGRAELLTAGYVVADDDAWHLRVTLPMPVEAVDLADDEAEVEPAPAAEPAVQLAAFPLPEVAGQLDLLDLDEHLADEPAGVELVVVPCSGAKLDEPAPAGRLYLGPNHRLARQAAATVAASTGARVVILSALHGLLDLDELVAPYDVTLDSSPTPAQVERVADQLRAAGATRVTALTTNRYTTLLRAAAGRAGVELVAPLAGCRGIGEQRGRLARLRDGRPLAA